MENNKNSLVITIIIHFRSPEECILLINDLQRITWDNHQILVVDNQSGESDFDLLKNQLKFSNVTLVKNVVNNGYGGGINYGISQIQHLNAEYYHIINTDIRIVNPNYITQIIEIFKNTTNAGLIGPGVETIHGNIQNTIMPFFTFMGVISRNIPIKSFISANPTIRIAEVINGVCLIVSSKAFNRINGFDEDFFMYGEEHDFCYRLKEKGYDSYFWSGIAITHLEGNERQGEKIFTWRDVLIRANQILFLKKRNKWFSSILLGILFSLSLIKKRVTGTKFIGFSIFRIIHSYFFPLVINRSII